MNVFWENFAEVDPFEKLLVGTSTGLTEVRGTIVLRMRALAAPVWVLGLVCYAEVAECLPTQVRPRSP